MPLAGEHDPREVVLDRDRDVQGRLVVPQPHVERRPVPLDEVLLEVERFDLRAGDDHLQVGDPRHEVRDRGAHVAAARLEVGAHARPQRLRLPDVQHVAPLVAEEVDPGFAGSAFNLPETSATTALAPDVQGSEGTSRRVGGAALAPAATAGGSSISLGAAEDAVRAPTLVESEATMGLLRLAGFSAVRIEHLGAQALGPERARGRCSRTSPPPPRCTASGSTSRSTTRARARRRSLLADRTAFAAYVAEVVRANGPFGT